MMKNLPFLSIIFLFSSVFISLQAQSQPALDTSFKKYLTSENGLDHRSFLYAGEWDTRHPEAQKMFLVRNGKIAWEYSIPLHPSPGANQEFDDITMLPNRNIVFARMSGTTALASALLKRKWIGSEISEEYVKIANERLNKNISNDMF